jgi:hypothetical protein
MTEFEQNYGGQYWKQRKNESLKFDELSFYQKKKMSIEVREELAIVLFLTEVNREIEIIGRNGVHKILLF